MQINKKATVLVLLMVISMIAMIPLLHTNSASAIPVTNPSPYPNIVTWLNTTAEASLWTNPEWLTCQCISPVITNTWITVEGKDTYGQNIEATAFFAPTVNEIFAPFLDPTSGQPVAFAQITGIYQKNGSDNERFQVFTQPVSFEQYLGQYHSPPGPYTGWLPGQYSYGATYNPSVYGGLGTKYLVGNGTVQKPKIATSPFQVEPANPDPLKVYINWHETDGDLLPDAGDTYIKPASGNFWIMIVGLDERGAPLIVNMTVPQGVQWFPVPTPNGHTWSAVCMVYGNGPDSYYILTEPAEQWALFTYTLLIDHIAIQPCSYDVIANPKLDQAHTVVVVTLMDRDGNMINAPYGSPIDVNFATTGGTIAPASDVWIEPGYAQNCSFLCADTNPRTINVTAFALIPAIVGYHKALDCFAWTEMTFDGVSSYGTLWTTIHTLMWGWNTWNYTSGGQLCTIVSTFTGPVPPKPTTMTISGEFDEPGYVSDGPIYEVMIPLYPGCNLISSPVHPLLVGEPNNLDGIPLSYLFNNSALIKAVWYYEGNTWEVYIPGVSTTGYFEDGFGYWVYATQQCTIEISGVVNDNGLVPSGGLNGPNPAAYELEPFSWNLVGFTSITPMSISNYLESLNTGTSTTGATTLSAVGPVWTYYAYADMWFRDPSWGLYPGYGFWVYNKLDTPLILAP